MVGVEGIEIDFQVGGMIGFMTGLIAGEFGG